MTERTVKIVITAEDRTAGAIGTARSGLTSLGQSMTQTGMRMTVGLTTPIVLGMKEATEAAGDFEAQVNILSLAAAACGTPMEDLSKASIEVGNDVNLVGIDAAQAADSLTTMYKAGLTTSQIFGGPGGLNSYLNEGAELSGGLRTAVDLAAASDLDLAAATDAVVIAMATFGIEGENAQSIADSFVQSADASVAEVSDLAAAMYNAGPTFASYGWGLGEMNTALAILSQRGIRGSEAGTALKSMMVNMMRTAKPAKEALASLGVSLYDLDGNLKPLPQILGEISAGMEGWTEQQQLETKAALFGSYGLKAANTLLAEGTAGWDDMTAAIGDAASAHDVMGVRTQGLNAAVEALKGQVQTFMIVAGTQLINMVVLPLVQGLQKVFEWLMQLDPSFLRMGIVILGVLAAAGPLLMMLGTLFTILGAIASPIGLIVIGVAALIAAFVAANGGIGPTIEMLKGVWAAIVEKVSPAIELLEGIWNRAWPTIQATVDQVLGEVVPFVRQMIGEVVDFVGRQVEWITAWIDENSALIQKTIEYVMGAIQWVMEKVWPIVKNVIERVWKVISTIVEGTIRAIFGVIKAVMQAITGDWKGAWETIKKTVGDFLAAMWNALDAAFGDIVRAVGNFLSNVWNSIKTWFEDTWTKITTWLSDLWTSITTWLADAWESISTWLTDLWTAVSEWFEEAIQSIIDWFEEIWETISQWVEDVVSLIEGWAEDIVEIIETWANNVIETIEGWVSDVVEIIETWVSDVVEIIEGWAANLITAWTGIRDKVVEWFGKIKESITDKFQAAVDAVIGPNGIVTRFKGTLSTALGNVATAVKEAFKDVYEYLTSPFTKMAEYLSKLKIKLPHIKVGSTTGPMGVTLPTFDIEWYGNGLDAVFASPTIIGVGERGAERVTVSPVGTGAKGGGGTYTITVYAPTTSAQDIVARMRDAMRLMQMGTAIP